MIGPLEHRGDSRLVVGAENRAGSVADDAVVVDHGLDRRRGRHGVEMSAEKDRRAAVRPFEAAVEIADVRADGVARSILVDGQSEVAQVADDRIRNGAFVAGWARQRSQLGKETDDLGAHRAILVRAVPLPVMLPSFWVASIKPEAALDRSTAGMPC